MTAISRTVHRIDASDRILGRLASEIALLLRGKNKLGYNNYQDLGDFVAVSNAVKIKVTGAKLTDKLYYRHSAYPGALKSQTLAAVLATRPERVIIHAVKNMLPSNRLRSLQLKRLSFN